MAISKITKPSTPIEEIDKINEIIDNLGSSSIDVDSALSTTSENPVQNKVITSALDGKLDISGGNMTGNLSVNTVASITTNGYVVGTWLQTKSASINNNLTTVAMLDGSGWIYKQSKDTLLSGVVKSVNDTSPDSNGNVTITIPDAQVNSDWNASSGVAKILNKPSLATVATSGSYNDLSNKPTIPTVNNATLTITQGGTTKGTFTANASSNVTIDLDAGGGSSRNIGEIVASTIPLTDAGLHLLDGALIQGDGIYSDFVGYIAGLDLTANYFCTEQEWQASVTQYGVCGKFVYDAVNNTVRLPKITGIIEGTTDLTALGDLVQAGLPNIAGHSPAGAYWLSSTTDSSTGPFYRTIKTSNSVDGQSSQKYSGELYFDASRSNSIYGNSDTVQPQTIKVLYYIVIATSTKTDIQVDIDNIATDLNGKADIDLTNTTNQAKILMSGMGMPSDTYIDLTLGASGTQYTAPADGWFVFGRTTNSTNQYISLSNGKVSITSFAPQSGRNIRVYIPVLKNDNVNVNYSAAGTILVFRFIYAVGSESEA